jgi:DNA-binding transcriptional ArsR family regulator
MSGQTIQMDSIFRALADPTRRQVLESLSRGPAPVSQLAEPFTMALPSFLQHLHVLEQCGLVSSQKTGRVRIYRFTPAPLRGAEHWIARQRTMWEQRLDQLDNYLHTIKEKDHEPED